MVDLSVQLGGVRLRTPLIAASGTVGSVVDFVDVGIMSAYGAAVAKSVSEEPWPGRPPPRLAPAGHGMLNGIGIQNPGVEAWSSTVADHIGAVGVPVWGSAVGRDVDEFGRVAKGLASVGVSAIEVNLSCPNLEEGTMFALDAGASARAVSRVRQATELPIGAKLSPNAVDIVEIATAVAEAGADWVVLTNSVWGFGVDIETRRPLLSGGIGGYSGVPLKPVALRCVWEVSRALPTIPIVGCGGIRTGEDAIEFLMAGAAAVAIGSIHFAEPRAGSRILRELRRFCRRHEVGAVQDLVRTVEPW